VQYWLNTGFIAVHQMVPVAQAAERLGFHGVAMPDHLFFPEKIDSPYPYSNDGAVSWPADAPWPDCWVTLGVLAQATQRLRLTTGVLVAPLRDVFSLAKAIGTAAAFGPGRVSCGLGAGWLREEFDIVGQHFDTRGARMDEMLDVLRLLWSGELVEHHGVHLDFGPVQMRPAAANVPILIGGNTAPAMRRAARHDGWIGTYTDLEDVTRMVGTLRDLRSRAGADDTTGAFEILLAATPGVAKQCDLLHALGVDGLIVPVAALGATTATDDLVAGLERFAQRWM
jgi:probable F420-dependent oxidoreductase